MCGLWVGGVNDYFSGKVWSRPSRSDDTKEEEGSSHLPKDYGLSRVVGGRTLSLFSLSKVEQ